MNTNICLIHFLVACIFFFILDMFNYVVLIFFIEFKSDSIFGIVFDTVNNFLNMGVLFVVFVLVLLL